MKNLNQKVYPATMRGGWTLIELIFIMVVIGILAGIAIKKLSVTRDDAALSTDVSNMNICIKDAQTFYTATGQDFTNTNNSTACTSVTCYDITYAINGIDFNVTTNPTAAGFCFDIDYIGGYLAKSYTFGGNSVAR